MFRALLTNKWFLGGCSCFVVYCLGCYFWYQRDINTFLEKIESSPTETERRQQVSTKKTNAIRKMNEIDVETPDTSHAEKQTDSNLETITDTVPDNVKAGKVSERVFSETPDTENTEEVRVSPHGFGPYPEVPTDFPFQEVFKYSKAEEQNVDIELIDRVFVKLWKQGRRDIEFVTIDPETKLVYPISRGIAYVKWGEYQTPDGELRKYVMRFEGHQDDFPPRSDSALDTSDDIPPGLKVLDFSEGINPYEFLELP